MNGDGCLPALRPGRKGDMVESGEQAWWSGERDVQMQQHADKVE